MQKQANTKKADEELFERHKLPDEMRDHVAAQVKEIESDAVSPKCNMDAEEMMENKIEEYAVRPKCDVDAESSDVEEKIEQEQVNETAAANDEISKKETEIRKFMEERRNISNKEKLRLKDLSKQIRKCIRDKKSNKDTRKIQKFFEDF